MMSGNQSILSRGLGLAFVLVVLITGALAIRERNYHDLRKIGPADWGAAFTADANTDAWLRASLREPDWQVMTPYPQPSKILRKSIETLPADRAILLIANQNDPNFLTVFSIIQYFSIPRRVYHLDCSDTDAAALPNERVGAVVYFNVASSKTIAQGKNILPQLTFVPVSQSAEWKSYCLP